MIAGDGWVAVFRYEYNRPDGTKRYEFSRQPVVFFDEDGVGWLAPEGEASPLRSAESYSNFAGYDRDAPAVAIMPGEGWTRSTTGQHVLAWVLFADGDVRPVTVNGDGTDTQDAYTAWDDLTPPGGWPEDGAS
jgi:hypothetical protein